MLNETAAATSLPVTDLSTITSVKADVISSKPPAESSKISEPSMPLATQKLSSPPITKKGITEAARTGNTSIEQKQSAKIENVGEIKNGEMKGGEVNQAQLRPSNPFAKPSNNQESLLYLILLRR